METMARGWKRGARRGPVETAKGDFQTFSSGPRIQIHERPVKGDGKVLPAEFRKFPDFRPAK
jgi:hypothetical protein